MTAGLDLAATIVGRLPDDDQRHLIVTMREALVAVERQAGQAEADEPPKAE